MRVELKDIHKSFGAVRANDGISLTANAGTIHGLLGENGAGKSTLMKILSGLAAPDRGEIHLDGNRVRMTSPAQAIRLGIGMLHQDPLDFPALSVLDNFLLGTSGLLPDRERAGDALRSLAAQFGFTLYPEAPCAGLSVGERQQLEILRLLWLGVQVLILDEPTTAISASQRVKLFAALRKMAGQGRVVLFVSHKLEEVQELCTSVSILRHGKVAGEATAPFATDRLVRLMFGQEPARTPSPRIELGPPALDVSHMTVHGGHLTVPDVSVRVHAGEVVGLAGLEGSGQRLFLHACAGLARPAAGSVRIGGTNMDRGSYRQFLSTGGAYLPAGRLDEGLIPGFTLTEHVALGDRRRSAFVDWAEATRSAAGRIREFNIRGTPRTCVEDLSGGNQQRALLALLPERVTVLLMEHPTRGLDIDSAEYIWSRLFERRLQGTATVFSSSDLDELLERSDRILVFFGGRVAQALETREATVQQLGELMGGTGV